MQPLKTILNLAEEHLIDLGTDRRNRSLLIAKLQELQNHTGPRFSSFLMNEHPSRQCIGSTGKCTKKAGPEIIVLNRLPFESGLNRKID